MSIEELRAKYMSLAHAMQSGVEMKRSFSKECEPKHLRVGINSAMVGNGALVQLLIKKGVFTEEEYMEELVAAMEREVKAYEQELSEAYGHQGIKLA